MEDDKAREEIEQILVKHGVETDDLTWEQLLDELERYVHQYTPTMWT